MELTQKSLIARLEQLKKLKDEPESFEALTLKLHEKGVECAIIVPLLEAVLDFDSLKDINYELESPTKHGQRFDFLVEESFLIEAKALGANLDEHREQISRYIKNNDQINYGLLTNGIDYQIWVQKSFIESTSSTALPHTDAVTKVFELSLEVDDVAFVVDAISIFQKDSYKQSFDTIAAIAGKIAASRPGKWPVLHQDRKINDGLLNRIKEAISVKTGFYYKDIEEGKLSSGDKLHYKDECVDITVEVTPTGTVILHKGDANILDLVKAMDQGWKPMIDFIEKEWSSGSTGFDDPLDIIRKARNMQRPQRARYEFKPVEPQ